VADEVRLSVSQFSGAFRRSVGEPPARYLRRYRVKRAQEMMLLTGESLATIAVDCGFADQSHFTRIFSRMVGVSPAAWRRALFQRTRADAAPGSPPVPLWYVQISGEVNLQNTEVVETTT
jgi:transcriptional regulator GlxA family with amidase domain